MKTQTGNNNSAARKSARIIRAGFVAVMLLIVGIAVFLTFAQRHARDTLNQIAHNDQLAIEMQFRMLRASRQRSVVLHRIITTDDPFERDEQALRFDELGANFGAARRQLLDLDLDSRARALLEKQRLQTAAGMNWQLAVLDKARVGLREEALWLLVNKAIPVQDAAFGTIHELMAHQLARSHDRAEHLRQLQGWTIWLLAAIGTVAMLIVGGIARYVRLGMERLVAEVSASGQNLEQAYRQMEFQKLAMDQHDIVSIADIHGNISYVNDKFCEVSQYSREELVGKNHRLLKSGVHPDGLYREIWETIATGRVWHGELCNRKKGGGLYWVSTTIVPFLDDAGLPYQYVSVRTDITDIKEAQQVLLRGRDELEELVLERTAELAEREDVLRSITDSAHDAVIMLDPGGKVTFWNPAAEKLFGYAESGILGRSFHALLVSGRQLEEFGAEFTRLQKSGAGAVGGKTAELKALRNDGAEIFVEIALSAVRIKGGWHVVGIARDITARKLAEQELELLVITDPLTGASNRRRFDGALHAEIARSRRYGVPVSLVLFDIDYFKRINDSLGHPVGDRVLVQLAELVAGNIRETDLFARLGGEEFAVLAPNCDAACARQFAEKLRRVVEAHAFPDMGERLTCSFGVAEFCGTDGQDTLVRRADEALYRAKGEGRNRVVVAEDSAAG